MATMATCAVKPGVMSNSPTAAASMVGSGMSFSRVAAMVKCAFLGQTVEVSSSFFLFGEGGDGEEGGASSRREGDGVCVRVGCGETQKEGRESSRHLGGGSGSLRGFDPGTVFRGYVCTYVLQGKDVWVCASLQWAGGRVYWCH